ncbi:MAG: hypothetical protein AUJ37_01005 [Candidatus Magasanikbacteria bacterium CG1_02_41_34]|nr:MAG: hypothetical protein AUJ37_01005 [Candidatus Magasanikbacteria bacterium CG1_02_41_34]
MNSTLSQSSLAIIKAYETLTFGKSEIVCPYYNNKRQKVRGALRVLIGKGSPKEITEEATIMALRKHIDLRTTNAKTITQFLVDNNLGIDCSGFVYHVLDAETKATKGKHLKSALSFPLVSSPIRKLLTKLRPVENINVKTLAHKKNSSLIALSDIKAGDFITMIGSKKIGNPDHILLVTSTDKNTIHLVHSYKLPKDGKYNHGIKHCTITLYDPKKSLVEQDWNDTEMSNVVKEAEILEMRRLH